MGTYTEQLTEILKIEQEGRRIGAEQERARLRPLLERCLALAESHVGQATGGNGDQQNPLLADLRRELGKEG